MKYTLVFVNACMCSDGMSSSILSDVRDENLDSLSQMKIMMEKMDKRLSRVEYEQSVCTLDDDKMKVRLDELETENQELKRRLAELPKMLGRQQRGEL